MGSSTHDGYSHSNSNITYKKIVILQTPFQTKLKPEIDRMTISKKVKNNTLVYKIQGHKSRAVIDGHFCIDIWRDKYGRISTFNRYNKKHLNVCYKL
jgi:hypothetical protein